MFFIAGTLVQLILGGMAKLNGPNIELQPTIFELMVWFHCENVVWNEVEKTLSLKIKYRAGNIIGLVVH